jgi:hypothetical protein
MDITKIKIPMVVVVAALGLAAGSGGSVAVANSKIDSHGERLSKMERERQEDHDLLIKIKTVVERIDQKLGGE